MVISIQFFYIILGVLAGIIIARPLYARFIKKQGNKYDAMYVLLLILLPVNWSIPRILTITDCNQYKQEVALFPTEVNGEKISYWKKIYIFNQSQQDLLFEFIYYGNKEPKENEQNHTIAPGESVKVPTVVIDYFFEQPNEKVSSKSDGAKKTYLGCL